MRKFMCDYNEVLTLDDVRKCYEDYYLVDEMENGNTEPNTFEQYLSASLGKNGALIEIETEDSPKGQACVSYYMVIYDEDNEDDVAWEWFYRHEILKLKDGTETDIYGHRLVKIWNWEEYFK